MSYFGHLLYNTICKITALEYHSTAVCKIDTSFLPKQTDGQTSNVTDVVRNTHISLTLSVLFGMYILRAHEAEHRKM